MSGDDTILTAGTDPVRTAFADALRERYLTYALSTITSRSLPDVRDGLKPVHRRLLFAMRQLRLGPDQGFKKSARVVGDVMGKFHPHGDAAIYDAMVRLAQDFAMRYPLVDGQGNFGNIDGDNAAAMRYTEARMSRVAERLLDGIDEDAVDFRQTYDGEGEEPALLPAAFPNLLANGAQGIAVGMATSIPPHNLAELADAALHLIRYPNAGHDTIASLVKGPDFPTGGVLVEEPGNIAEAYRIGRGSFRVRAAWMVEKHKGGSWQIVITAIPYQVQKSRLIEKMAEMLQARKLPVLADIRDESTDELRLVLEPKSRRLEADAVMETLFRTTELESRISLNLNVLDADGAPRVMPLREAVRAWIDHQQIVLQRRTSFRLGRIAQRLDMLEGYLIVYLNLDEVIAIIREAEHPKPALMERFALTDSQATAILDMRLRALRRLEEIAIRKERETLLEEQAGLQALLADPSLQMKRVAADIRAMKAEFADDHRRTLLGVAPLVEGDPMALLVEREPVTVICSANGWIRAAKGHLDADAEIKFKEGDGPGMMIHAETTDKLLILAETGRVYTLAVDRLPGGRGFGEPLSVLLEMGPETAIVAIVTDCHEKLLIASSSGHGFIVPTAEIIAQKRQGKQVLLPITGARAKLLRPASGDSLAVVGSNRKMLVFPLAELPQMARGKGVLLQRYREGELADALVFLAAEGISWRQTGGRTRSEPDLAAWHGKRASVGKPVPTGFPRPARFD